MDPNRPLFETSEGAASENGASSYESVLETQAAAEEAPVVEEAAVEAAAEAAPEEPPAWFKEYLDRTEPIMNSLGQVLAEPEPQQQQQEVDLSQLDMTNPEHVAWLVQHQIQRAMSPYEPIMGMQAEQQGREVANKFFTQLEAEVGAFDHEQALTHYTALMAENPSAQPEQVLQYAARQVADYEKTIRAQAVEAYKASQLEDSEKLRALSEAKNQPGAGDAALENEELPSGRDKYEIMASRWQSRQDIKGLGV